MFVSWLKKKRKKLSSLYRSFINSLFTQNSIQSITADLKSGSRSSRIGVSTFGHQVQRF